MEIDDDDDEAMEAAFERCFEPHPRDLLRREYDEHLKGRPVDTALEKWGPDIEMDILRHLPAPKPQAAILPFSKHGKQGNT